MTDKTQAIKHEYRSSELQQCPDCNQFVYFPTHKCQHYLVYVRSSDRLMALTCAASPSDAAEITVKNLIDMYLLSPTSHTFDVTVSAATKGVPILNDFDGAAGAVYKEVEPNQKWKFYVSVSLKYVFEAKLCA